MKQILLICAAMMVGCAEAPLTETRTEPDNYNRRMACQADLTQKIEEMNLKGQHYQNMIMFADGICDEIYQQK